MILTEQRRQKTKGDSKILKCKKILFSNMKKNKEGSSSGLGYTLDSGQHDLNVNIIVNYFKKTYFINQYQLHQSFSNPQSLARRTGWGSHQGHGPLPSHFERQSIISVTYGWQINSATTKPNLRQQIV